MRPLWTTVLRALAMVMPAMAIAGCRAPQLQRDQDQFRACLMQMYTDQVMDNLIRCENGLPFVQLDYSKITGTITQNGQATIGGTQGLETDPGRGGALKQAAALTFTFARKLTSGQSYGGLAYQQNQLTVTADPVVNDPSIYRAYLNFLNTKQHEPYLVATDCPPPPGAALIVKPWGGLYYWVPVQYREQFRELSLRTTALRGGESTPPDAWQTTVTGVEGPPRLGELLRKSVNGLATGQEVNLTLKVNPAVPADEGDLEAVIDGRILHFHVTPTADPTQGKSSAKPGAGGAEPPRAATTSSLLKDAILVNSLNLNYTHDFRPDEQISERERQQGSVRMGPDELTKALANQNVKIRFDRYRPPIPKTDDLLKSIDNEIRLFRLNTTQALH